MSRYLWILLMVFIAGNTAAMSTSALAQPLGEPDRDSPGDAMIQAYLARESEKLSAGFLDDIMSHDNWTSKREQYLDEYYYMLGLTRQPEQAPLAATVTGTLDGDGFTVEMLHYQSRPRLYVTGNLYRPAKTKKGAKLPAVLYVCGHSGRGRNGNKVAFQSHGMWFARHGYICLVIDTLQLGEIAATHHGTYNLERWWWHSRGYTPAGVEALNGIRGIDYLVSRSDVDRERIAVTGISGGGAATFWISAADDRVNVAVPVSGMADLESYVSNRVINGHCDCMFLYNTFQWPWTRIAGLVAPRPMLFVNSDQDSIFPMDANERIINRLERLYSLYGMGDRIDSLVSVGGHDYRTDIRQAVMRFINFQLLGSSPLIPDGEVEALSDESIPPEQLRVFPTDTDLPADQLNTTVDEHFVPLADVAAPDAGEYDCWKAQLIGELSRVSFRYFPKTIPTANKLGDVDSLTERLESEPGIEFRVRYAESKTPDRVNRVLLVVLNEDEAGTTPEWLSAVAEDNQAVVLCEPRGIGMTKWTSNNPPNYVERSHALLGRTVDAGRVWDVIAAAQYLPESSRLKTGEARPSIQVAGNGRAGLIAAYAAVLHPSPDGVTLVSPATTHMDSAAPQFLNVLRVCDVPDALGLLAPRPLTIIGSPADPFARTAAAYAAAEAEDRVSFK